MIARQGFRRILDVGCADGHCLIDACTLLPDVTGGGIEISGDMLTLGEERVREQGLEGRISVQLPDLARADALRDGLHASVVATAFFILHEALHHGASEVTKLLSNFRRLLPEVPLMVFAPIRAPLAKTQARSGMAPECYLQHDLTSHKLVTAAEWLELFRSARFSDIEERNLAYARTAIFVLR